MSFKEPSLRNLTKKNFGEPKETQNPLLQALGAPHVDSFNYMVDTGLKRALNNLTPIQFTINDDRLKFTITDFSLDKPEVPPGTVCSKKEIFPSFCRQMANTYKGTLMVKISWWLNGVEQEPIIKDVGNIPIMVKSKKCHLNGLSPKDLVAASEHEDEWGGYFIIKGHEKLVRMLLMTRKNYPVAVSRKAWADKGKFFTTFGVLIRCVKDNHTTVTNVLHYLKNSTIQLHFTHNRKPFYVPLMMILKCLVRYNDKTILLFKFMEGRFKENKGYTRCLRRMIRDLQADGLYHTDECKEHLGKIFRVEFSAECPPWFTDTEVADHILNNFILPHLENNYQKFDMLVFMTEKLYALTEGKCKIEGVDSLMMQEVLLGGHLYLAALVDKLNQLLYRIKKRLMVFVEKGGNKYKVNSQDFFKSVKSSGNVDIEIERFFSTGRLTSKNGLGLMQNEGLTIVVENINRMRYMSHFKSIHRGSFFTEMRTTEVRKLLPDAWGFICPVHTPDGTPCGLLNHLTSNCIVTTEADPEIMKKLPEVLFSYGGLMELEDALYLPSYLILILDGRPIGCVPEHLADDYVKQIRNLKIKGIHVPRTTEIVMVKRTELPGQYPGIFLFTCASRLMREVRNIQLAGNEYIGTFEQVYMEIAIRPSEVIKGKTTHLELSKTNFLSHLARLIPLPDCNPSPRNMYQCQMGKQTMGTPCHNWRQQAESKLYRLTYPQSPLFRPRHYDDLDMDDFPMGTNAVVAVISYTGYDMEDAMVINKASHDFGFTHGAIIKSQFVSLDRCEDFFCTDPNKPDLKKYLDTDGLPFVGRIMNDKEPFYCYYDSDKSQFRVQLFTSQEPYIVDNVKQMVDFSPKAPRVACITFRIPRNPAVGDKFASRAGQKGILSMLYKREDLPYSETGMIPDIIFNPHGFPSRMTVAMMIEFMAGKAAAAHGLVFDATPFRFSEEQPPIEYFGELLTKAGYQEYGMERFYSGKDGKELESLIFTGVVHYQRLRHMVSDKFQVRSTGPIDLITRQPIKGRKKGGAVRFGEMERDCLIAHGAPFLLQDRFLYNSDHYITRVCAACESLISPITKITRHASKKYLVEKKDICNLCGKGDHLKLIEIPYIFQVLLAELGALNINLNVAIKNVGDI